MTPDTIGLPAVNACLSPRRFAIHVRAPRHGRIVSVTIRAGRRAARTIAGRGRRTAAAIVDLRGFAQRKVTVRIDLRTAGHRYRSKRTYRICGGR